MIKDISTFKVCASVAADLSIYLAIKGFNRIEVKERIAQRKAGLSEKTDSNIPPLGAVLSVPLNVSVLNDDMITSCLMFKCKNPYEFHGNKDFTYYLASDLAILTDHNNSKIFTHELFRRAHSIDYSAYNRSFLISSSAFDLLYVLDQNFILKKVLSIWDFLTNTFDHHYVLEGFCNSPTMNNRTVTVINPKIEPNGLNVKRSPFYVTGARFGFDSDILITGYNSGSIFLLHNNSIAEKSLNLSGPHCFEPILFHKRVAYSVVDSGNGRVLKLNCKLNQVEILDISRLPKTKAEMQEGEWIQYVRYLNSDYSIIAIVDAIRCCVHLVDTLRCLRRSIPYPVAWSVHGISLVCNQHQSGTPDRFA